MVEVGSKDPTDEIVADAAALLVEATIDAELSDAELGLDAELDLDDAVRDPVAELREASEEAARVAELRANAAEPVDLFTEVTRLVTGLMTITLRAIRTALAPAVPAPSDEGAEPGLLALLPGAAVAIVSDAERRVLRTAAVLDERVGPVVRSIGRFPLIQGPMDAARRSLESLSARGEKEQQRSVEAVESLLERVLPEVVAAVLDRLDLNDIIARVDVDRIIDRVDLDAVMTRISIDDILSRVDFDGVIDRVDVGRIVDRVDVDGVVAKVDVDAVIKRLDLAGLTSDVMNEVDLREIVRESTSSISGEAVDAVRIQGMNADRFVSRIVDRLLMRKAGRDLVGPADADTGPGAASVDPSTEASPGGGGPQDADAGGVPVRNV